MFGGVGEMSKSLYPGKLSFQNKGDCSSLPPLLLLSSLPFSVFSLTFGGCSPYFGWGRGVNMSLHQRKETWRFLSTCRMMALLSCLPLGESFWPFIKIPRPFHCLPSGCCHRRMNLGPLRRTDFWNLWPSLPPLCFLKSPTYECEIERGHLPRDNLHMQRILWINNIRQDKSLLQLFAGLWHHRHFTHTPQLWPLYPKLSWVSIHHHANTWLHPTVFRLQCWTPHTKQ